MCTVEIMISDALSVFRHEFVIKIKWLYFIYLHVGSTRINLRVHLGRSCILRVLFARFYGGLCKLFIVPILCNSSTFSSPEVLWKSLEGKVSEQDFVVKNKRKKTCGHSAKSSTRHESCSLEGNWNAGLTVWKRRQPTSWRWGPSSANKTWWVLPSRGISEAAGGLQQAALWASTHHLP